ncbi:hypothetical protein AAW30_01869 [Arcobacter porcinus]|nr:MULTISPECIES: hypothetical protein [Arcobacteraceae]OCL81570.1 hypothetical protein AAW30_01869 [Arcobacter porcinus]OCL93473.1 hypothetical protein AAX28_01016 [Arcobacter porcinus]
MNSKLFNKTNLEERDLKLLVELSNVSSKYDKYIVMLKRDYGYTLTKSQLARVINVSEQTITRRIEEGLNVPKYLRSGDGPKSSYIFPITEVADYLSNCIKIFGLDND